MLSNRSDLLATLAANGTRIYIERYGQPSGVAQPWSAYLTEEYPKCGILVHEFAHLIQYAIEEQLGGSEFNSRLQATYQAALNAGRWQGLYASTYSHEYWAEAVLFWFWKSLPNQLKATYSNLADYDPEIATLVEEVFGDSATVPADCKP